MPMTRLTPFSNHLTDLQYSYVIGFVLILLLILGPQESFAQTFNPGSTGSDGALVLTTPGVIDFDPTTFNPPLDPDDDNVYHFTSITIGAGVTVRLTDEHLAGPVYWLASGPIQIDGTIDLNGEDSVYVTAPSTPHRTVAGAGGFTGGTIALAPSSTRYAGWGPGGGIAGSWSTKRGIAAAHRTASTYTTTTYGNDFLVPLTGGSGGSGGVSSGGGSTGAAGGGAILLATVGTMTINGAITARGGDSIRFDGHLCSTTTTKVSGGAGSGGSIHLLADRIEGAGALDVSGGCSQYNSSAKAGSGYIRLEAVDDAFTGTLSNSNVPRVTPYAIFLQPPPEIVQPSIAVVTVDGNPVPVTPTGSFALPDVTITTQDPVDVVVEATNVPVGMLVALTLQSENGTEQVLTGTLVGTEALSTATISVVFPTGFTSGFAYGPLKP